MTVQQNKKLIKIVRVVTSAEAVIFHLKNTLLIDDPDIHTVVVGNNVSELQKSFPATEFIDLDIRRPISLFNDLKSVIALYIILTKQKPDIVHSVMPKAGLVASLAAIAACIPVRIHTFTGQTWATASGLKKALLLFFDKVICKLNTICFTDSPSQSEFLFRHGIKIDKKSLPVIHKGSLSGVDLKRFNRHTITPNRSQVRQSLNIADSAVVFIFIGRKHPDKGVFELISAFKHVKEKHPSARLVLVGPDETDGHLQAALDYTDSDVVNLPVTDTPEVYLNAADIFCLPSYREGFGTVIIEAAALSIPAIGTHIPGLVDSIVENKTGLLVEVKDIDSLSKAMCFLIENPETRHKLSDAAAERAKQYFDSHHIYRELKQKYAELLKIKT